MTTETALDNAIARKSRDFTAGYWAGVAFWDGIIRDLLRQLEKEERTEIIEACDLALRHVEELEEAWLRGILSENDGKGGTRSNRNAELRVRLHGLLTKIREAPKNVPAS